MGKKKAVGTDQGQFTVSIKSFGGDILKGAGTPHSNAEAPFDSMYKSQLVIRPTYDPYRLCQLTEISDILKQCIEAMVVNVDGFGWEVIPAAHREEEDGPPPTEAIAEQRHLESFFGHVNHKQDLTLLRQELRADIEATGDWYMELVPNRKGELAELYRLPAHSMRKAPLDEEFTEFEQPIRNADGKFELVQRSVRFRRYCQIINGSNKVWFKEFGDPRPISAKTGKVVGARSNNLAHEVINQSLFAPHSVYGQPRWIGALIKILGTRKADEVNYLFFDNKGIPPVVVTVSGGMLTRETVKQLTEVFEKEIKGVQNFHKALVIEAVPAQASTGIEGEGVAPVRIDVKPLTQYIQDDGLFLKYMDNNRKAVRSSFRLGPLFTGESDDYTRATARVAQVVTEEQVFQPTRNGFDYIINTMLLPRLDVNHWTFHSLGAKTSDDTATIGAVARIKEAVPVGVLMEMVAQARNEKVGQIDSRWYDIPLSLMNAYASQILGEIEQPENPDDPDARPEDEEERTEKFLKSLTDMRARLLERVRKTEAGNGAG